MRDIGATGERELRKIQAGAEQASRSLDLLHVASRALQFAGIAASVRALVVAGDQFAQSMGRLTTAVGNVERASEVYEALYRNALQTGVSVNESVAAFNRFSVAAREIGATSDQVVRLVTGLQRVAIASGASTQEIQGSTQQLAQALASGVLQGDELRSILEGLPTLAQALARELGVSIGELRKLGSEGKLTADRVFPALLRAIERINDEFQNAPLSIGMAFGQLTAAADQFLARLDQAIGLSNTLARGLSAAARALDAVRRGSGLLTESERLADQRAQRDALRDQIARLEADAVLPPARRGTIGRGLAGIADQQAGVDRARRLEELRRQYRELNEEIVRQEREAGERTAAEQAAADQRAADARRQRALQDAEELRRKLDARYRITREFEDRISRLREQEAAGAIDAAERQRLEALATRERDEALQRLEGTTRRVAAATRENRDAERELNEVLRERERLIQQNETAYERYQRRLDTLGRLGERAERIGQPIPDETIAREAVAALEDLERAERRVEEAGERARDVGRELGLTFSSAFEDAIIRGKRFSEVLQGLGQDIARIIARRTITEPLGNAVSSALSGFSLGGVFGGIGSWLGGLFRADGGPVTAGQPYIVGERGPEWFVPRQSGMVLPNGVAPGGPTINTSIAIDARGADAGVEARLRLLAGQIARQALMMTLDAIRRGGAAYQTVRG
jgi:tape measure domain-containing protein